MSDPFSLAASVVGLVSLGIQVTQSLFDFYTSCRDRAIDLAGTTKKLENLLDIFQHLHEALTSRKFEPDERGLIETIDKTIGDCEDVIRELQEDYQKFTKTSPLGARDGIKSATRLLAYPFRRSTLQKLDENIGEIRANVSIALTALQLKDSMRRQQDIDDVKSLLDLVRANQISTAVCEWLKAPDASINHNAACTKRHQGTGMWLIKSHTYTTWLKEKNSILWLNGFAGCGKSVLCSTAIQYAFRHRRSDPHIGIAFFYFTFNDESKQDESAMLRALLLQLSSQLQDGHKDLTYMYESYKTGTPPSPVLLDYLRRLIQRFEHVYILLDALDECPRNGMREQLLDVLEEVRGWGLGGLHLFISSRDELDIRESINPSSDQIVTMRNAGTQKDITDYIYSRLTSDRRLRKYLPYREKIQEVLSQGAQGVFRWVDCQFKSLQSCINSEYHLDHWLKFLPGSLDETYERMLCSIDDYSVEEARRVLTFLCFASRPLSIYELIDGIAVEIPDDVGLNPKRRLKDPSDIQEICAGLIEICSDNSTDSSEKCSVPTVRIAHFSVQEYLVSGRIRQPKAEMFSLSSATAHAEISQICLLYLLEPALSSSELSRTVLEDYPLAQFAAMYWYYHYKQFQRSSAELLDGYISKLFQRQNSFQNWVRLHDVEKGWETWIAPDRAWDIASPIYYASYLGLVQVLNQLINVEQEKVKFVCSSAGPYISGMFELLNAKGGRYASALQAASYGGHTLVVDLLLEKGADTKAEGGVFGNALQAASYGGHEPVIRLLLESGADINAHGGEYGNALQAASYGGHESVVRFLLDNGANANTQDGVYGNALQAAANCGHRSVTQLLLQEGADVNAQGGVFGNALQAASYGGHESVMQLLLEKGADVGVKGGQYGSALQAASECGHDSAVEQLLRKGADVNARGGAFGNALQAASVGGHQSVVQLLIHKGADVNAKGGKFANALQAASLGGHESVTKILLENGAEINVQGGEYGNALQAASFGGHEPVVQLLLERGANVDAHGGYFGNALQAASYGGRESVVQQLLNTGAYVNAQGGFYGNALQAASHEGDDAVVQLLLKYRADVNAQGGRYGNALQAASDRGHKSVVELLLQQGADINAQGGVFGTALQAACFKGHELEAQLLLDKGANVNAQGGKYSNAIQAASRNGHVSVVKLLLENGANVNAQGELFVSPLHAASYEGHESVVQLLLEKGADTNAHCETFGNAVEAASISGHESVIKMLLRKGVDVITPGGFFGNALQAASICGHRSIIELLLQHGADVHAQGGFFGNALQAACFRGHESIAQLLLDKGANVNAQGGQYSTAMQAASRHGYVSVVQLLLEKGANINAQGGKYGNALQAACKGGHVSTVQLLLEKRADFNAQGGLHGTAMRAASSEGYDALVQLLLEKEASVNTECSEYGNAVQASEGATSQW